MCAVKGIIKGVILSVVFSPLLFNVLHAQRKDVILFDFESGDLAGWELKGNSFLLGGLPVNRQVSDSWQWGPIGVKGDFYLETGHDRGRHTNNPVGMLRSPEFIVNRNYLNFYLAGEVHPHVRVGLEVDGIIVREAFGNNFYDLFLRGWDVKEFRNKRARFFIEDNSRTRSLIRLDHIFLSDLQPPRESEWVNIPDRERSSIAAPGEFVNVFKNEQIIDGDWLIERSNIVRGPDGNWHMFSMVIEASNVWEPRKPGKIIYAMSKDLFAGWEYQGVVMTAESRYGEDFIVDPFVFVHEDVFYMFYVGAGHLWSGWYMGPEGNTNPWHEGKSGDFGPNSMFLATSTDGKNWERIGGANPARPGRLFTEKPFGLTPYVTKIEDEWVMFYASATNETVYSKHSIGYRISKDLINWGERKHALIDWSESDPLEAELLKNHRPASPWPEHSFFTNPVVFKYKDDWHLWAGPIDNSNLSRYHCLRIYISNSPFGFNNHHQAKMVNKRVFVDGGGRPFQNEEGDWFIFHTNSMSGGVWVAPLFWGDASRCLSSQ